VERLSDSPAGTLEDGLPPRMWRRWGHRHPGMPVHLRLQRVPRARVRIWQLFGRDVAAIPDLYQRYGYGCSVRAAEGVE